MSFLLGQFCHLPAPRESGSRQSLPKIRCGTLDDIFTFLSENQPLKDLNLLNLSAKGGDNLPFFANVTFSRR